MPESKEIFIELKSPIQMEVNMIHSVWIMVLYQSYKKYKNRIQYLASLRIYSSCYLNISFEFSSWAVLDSNYKSNIRKPFSHKDTLPLYGLKIRILI